MCAGLWETNKDCKSWEQGPSRVGLVYLANKNIECPVKTTNNLMTKVHMVKAIVFPVVMYGCESWTIKKAECQRIDAFELWCWRRLLRVPWTARRSNQSILKEINLDYSLEGLLLKLKLQYFGHLMQRAYSLEKTLMVGKTEGRRRRGWQRMRWLDSIINSMDMNLSKLREIMKDRGAWHAAVHGATKGWTWLGDWTRKRRVATDKYYLINSLETRKKSSSRWGYLNGVTWQWIFKKTVKPLLCSLPRFLGWNKKTGKKS